MISPSGMIEAIKSWCKSKFITEIPIGSSETVGGVKADGSTTTIDDDGTIHATGGSGSETSDYNALSNRPSIEGVTLSGNKTLSELGIQPEGTYLTEETDPTVPDWAKAESKPSYTAEEVGADKSGTAESKVSAHNTSIDSHSDIRLLIEGLQSKVNAVLDSDDETLDQMSEIVAYIKDNKELIEAITTNKVSVSDIVDNLTTNISNKPLSAAQGVALKALIDGIVVPTKISELTNDSGYITGISKSDVTSALGYTPPKEDTNTTYSAMTGATSSAAGKTGLVPAPAAGDNEAFLKGDGTWGEPVVAVDTLKSMEEVAAAAATEPEKPVGAGAVAELNDSLAGVSFVIDETTGEISGYTTEIGGADTVFPFSGAASGTLIIAYKYTLVVQYQPTGSTSYSNTGTTSVTGTMTVVLENGEVKSKTNSGGTGVSSHVSIGQQWRGSVTAFSITSVTWTPA